MHQRTINILSRININAAYFLVNFPLLLLFCCGLLAVFIFFHTANDFIMPVLWALIGQLGWGPRDAPPAAVGPALPWTGEGCRDGRPSVPHAAASAEFRGWTDNCKQLNCHHLMS